MSSTPWPNAALPLQPSDPPRVDEFWLDARLLSTPAGTAFAAHDDDGAQVIVILLSQGAANDPGARDRLAGEVNHLHTDTVIARGGPGQDSGRLGFLFRPAAGPFSVDGTGLAPWVALVNDGSPAAMRECQRILDAVDMSHLTDSPVSGPAYRLHWIDDTATGRTRLWPLPWPGRRDRAGWSTSLVAWLLTLLIALTGLLVAVLLFQNVPPSPPPPPVPTSASGSGGSGSPSSASASSSSSSSSSPSPSSGSSGPSNSSSQSGSNSPSSNRGNSASPSNSAHNNPSMPQSRKPSMSTSGSGTGSASASPTGRKKL